MPRKLEYSLRCRPHFTCLFTFEIGLLVGQEDPGIPLTLFFSTGITGRHILCLTFFFFNVDSGGSTDILVLARLH